jgi:hypothetical protein
MSRVIIFEGQRVETFLVPLPPTPGEGQGLNDMSILPVLILELFAVHSSYRYDHSTGPILWTLCTGTFILPVLFWSPLCTVRPFYRSYFRETFCTCTSALPVLI